MCDKEYSLLKCGTNPLKKKKSVVACGNLLMVVMLVVYTVDSILNIFMTKFHNTQILKKTRNKQEKMQQWKNTTKLKQ